MTANDLFCPELRVEIGQYQLSQGIAIDICSSKFADKDWGKIKFTKEYQEKLTVSEGETISVYLGYGSNLELIFSGMLSDNYNQGAAADEILFQDKSWLLEKTSINDSFCNCTPQEIILTGLNTAGVSEYQLSKEIYLPRSVPIAQKNMLDVLKQINHVWKLSIGYGFIKGIFYWGTEPDQVEQYEFTYGENILCLSRERCLWIMETSCVPKLQHSRIINVAHPKISGTFMVKKMHIKSDECGYIRYWIYF